jgi:myo-inositol 2-dehydrogenase/D-chiro-inositol 1-dehydrogenase
MIKLVVLGAGNHSRQNHLPSLSRYVAENPGTVELAGLCDLDQELATEMAQRYGFARAYTDLDEMLRSEQPDGCVSITPILATTEIAKRVLRAGVPLLMEKPPGATPREARSIVDLVKEIDAWAMVSMNRRFDPALRAAVAWWGDRPIAYLRGRMARVNRREADFMYGTAIHPLDAMRAIAGDVRDHAVEKVQVDGIWWYVIRLLFGSGTIGLLEVLPTAGSLGESYELVGDRVRALAGAGDTDSGIAQCWEDGELVVEAQPAAGMPGYVRNGTYAETCAFISALQAGTAPYPSLDQVLQSVELCATIQAGVARLS